ASVTGSLFPADLVPDVVLADRLFHRQALDLFERQRIVDDDRAVGFRQARQRIATVAGELDMSERLARLADDLPDDLQRLLVDDLKDVPRIRAHHRIDEGVRAGSVAAQEEARSTDR